MHRFAQHLQQAPWLRGPVKRPFAKQISNQKQRPKEVTGKVVLAGVATAAFGTGIYVTNQYADRTVYERKTIEKAKKIETNLRDHNLLKEGWHGIDADTLQASKGNPQPLKNLDGSIPISHVIKAGACSGEGGKIFPAVSSSLNPPVEKVSVGEFASKRCSGKHSNEEPDITKDAWQTSITVAGQKSGRAFVLVPDKQKEVGVDDVSLTWNPPKSFWHDFIEKYW
jgi:hypothetical protein